MEVVPSEPISEVKSDDNTINNMNVEKKAVENTQEEPKSDPSTTNLNVNVNVTLPSDPSTQLKSPVSLFATLSPVMSSPTNFGPRKILTDAEIEARAQAAQARVIARRKEEADRRAKLAQEETAKSTLAQLHIAEKDLMKKKLEEEIEIARFEYLEKKRAVLNLKDEERKLEDMRVLEEVRKAKLRIKEVPLHEKYGVDLSFE